MTELVQEKELTQDLGIDSFQRFNSQLAKQGPIRFRRTTPGDRPLGYFLGLYGLAYKAKCISLVPTPTPE